MFKHIPSYPGDPILSLMQTFMKDDRPDKANLSIGLYYDEAGKIPRVSGPAFSATNASEKKKRAEMLVPEAGCRSTRDWKLVFLASSSPSIPFVYTVRDSPRLKPNLPLSVPFETFPRNRPIPNPPAAPLTCPCQPLKGVGV